MKKLKGLIFLFALILTLGFFTSCDGEKQENEQPNVADNEKTETEETQQQKIYKLAVGSGYTGTYEEWLDSIKGDSIELKVDSNYIKWKFKKEANWVDLVNLTEFVGQDGKDGLNGKEIELSTNTTHILWRYVGDSEWNDLLSLETLGCDCTASDSNTTSAGQSAYDIAVELGYVGTVEDWILSLNGTDGLSAYEIYKKYYPEYVGTEEDWINDLVNGTLAEDDKKVTVTFKDGDTILKTEEYYYGQNINEPEDPVKEGYVFKGWKYKGEVWNFKFYNVGRNIDLQAEWDDRIYNIQFINENSIYKSYTCNYLEIISEPVEPTLENAFFEGWYLDSNFQTEYDFSLPIRDDLKLYAKWREPYEFNVNYYYNNELYDSEIVKEGKTITQYCYPEKVDENYFNALFYTTPNSELQTEETVWNLNEEIYEDVNLYCVCNRKLFLYPTLTCGEEQFSNLENSDGEYTFKYMNFDFGQIKGKRNKNGYDCLKTSNDTIISIFEESCLSIKVASGSSNSDKQYVALFRVTEIDVNGTMIAGELMTPSNIESASLVVDSGKVTLKQDPFSYIEYSNLMAGTYVLTAGGSNSLLNDSNGAGTNIIAEISLCKSREMYPIEYISLAKEYNYEFMEGDIFSKNDLKDLKIIANHETGYQLYHDYLEWDIDISNVDIYTPGTYNVDVSYVNPIDNEIYFVEGGLDIEIIEFTLEDVAYETNTYVFNWKNVDTQLLESTGTYDYDLEGNALLDEDKIAKYNDSVMSTAALLSGFDFSPNITVVGGLKYSDGLRYWEASESEIVYNRPCIELKGVPTETTDDSGNIIEAGGISITMNAPGKIAFTASSTEYHSIIGLLDSNGNWLTAKTNATLINESLSLYDEEEYGAYIVYGQSMVTFIFDIQEAGTYTIAVPLITRNTSAGIGKIIIQEN